MKWVVSVITAALVCVAGPASACRWIGNHRALIHSALPSVLPPEAIVLDVQIEGENSGDLYRDGLRARVRRVVSGDFDGAFVVVKLAGASSCDSPFENGSSGLIIGFWTPEETFSPVLVQQQYGFQLRPGDLVAAP